MGYRLRLGKVSKIDYEKYKDMTNEELCNAFPDDCDDYGEEKKYFPHYRPPFHTELYELGKYVDYEANNPFYTKIDMEECDFQIVDKEFLKMVIEDYEKKVKSYYKEYYNKIIAIHKSDSDTITIDKEIADIFSHVRSMASEWIILRPFSLDKPMTDGAVTKSWKYEYSIFNLVHMYWNFDWENDLLIYSGW